MFKVLIVDDNEDLLEILSVLLTSEFELNILTASSCQDAINLLKTESDIGLIISDYMLEIETSEEIFIYNSENENLPFVLLTMFNLSDCKGFEKLEDFNPINTHLLKGKSEEKLFDVIEQAIKEHEDYKGDSLILDSQYRAIPLNFFKKHHVWSDIYIKLSKDKFVKLVKKGEDLEEKALQYEGKGVQEFYIKREDLGEFFVGAKEAVREKLTEGQLSEAEAVEILGLNFEISFQALTELGIRKEHIELVTKSLESSIKKIQNNIHLNSLFSSFKKSGNYLRDHSLLSLYIATPIAMKMEWNSKLILEKLGMAAFFHDFGLLDEKRAKYEMLKLGEIDKSDQDFIRKHPNIGLEKVSAFDEIDQDTRNIILEHHERPDGEGYPRRLSASQITPLSAVFILAHDVACHLIENNYNHKAMLFYLATKKDYYCKGNFQKPFEVLLEMSKQG